MKTHSKNQTEIDAANQFHSFVRGWKDAVGTRAIDPLAAEHENLLIRQAYNAGYSRGCRDKGDVARDAADKYGYVINYLRLADDASAATDHQPVQEPNDRRE